MKSRDDILIMRERIEHMGSQEKYKRAYDALTWVLTGDGLDWVN